MNKTLIVLVLGALLLSPLAAAQDPRPEPNSSFDTFAQSKGGLTATNSVGATAKEYFDHYTYCAEGTLSPSTATGGRFLCSGTARPRLLWGMWADLNGDHCIGSCGAILVAGSATDGAFKAASPVTRSQNVASGTINNDGGVQAQAFIASGGDTDTLIQNEFRAIGPNDAAHGVNTNLEGKGPFQGNAGKDSTYAVYDATAVAWLDLRQPGQGAATRCLVPPPRGTFESVQGVYDYANDLTFDRLPQPGDLGVSGNDVAGVPLGAVWLGDEAKNLYNNSQDDGTGHASQDRGVAPTFDYFYHTGKVNTGKLANGAPSQEVDLSGVIVPESDDWLGPSNQPSTDWGVVNDLEVDGCNAGEFTYPKEPEQLFSYSAAQGADLDGDGAQDYPTSGGSWSAAGVVFSPVGHHPLGTLAHAAFWSTAYGFCVPVGARAGLDYAGVASTSDQGDQVNLVPYTSGSTTYPVGAGKEGLLWYHHPVSWRDTDCFGAEPASGVSLGPGSPAALLSDVDNCF